MGRNRGTECEEQLETMDDELLEDSEAQYERKSDPFFWLAANIEKVFSRPSETESVTEDQSDSAVETTGKPGSKKKKKKKRI